MCNSIEVLDLVQISVYAKDLSDSISLLVVVVLLLLLPLFYYYCYYSCCCCYF